MSRYGSVAISGPSSLITRIVESSLPDDLGAKVNAAITGLPSGYVVVAMSLAGAGDGFSFTVTIEAGAPADTTGGFTSPPSVACFLASEAQALLLARERVAPGSGTFADTQVAGASQGTRFMGMLVLGTLASSGGGGAIVRMGFDNSTERVQYPVVGNSVPVLRDNSGAPLSVPLTGFKPGNLILIVISISAEDFISSGPTGAAIAINPTVDVGTGPRTIHTGNVQTNCPGGTMPALTWASFVVPVPSDITADPIIGVELNAFEADPSAIEAYNALLVAAEVDASFITQLPTTFLDP